MIFTETALPGVYIIDLDPHQDERGFFARTFCQREFDAHGLTPVAAQSNLSFNHRQGTLRPLVQMGAARWERLPDMPTFEGTRF